RCPFFLLTDPCPAAAYRPSLHDALPISRDEVRQRPTGEVRRSHAVGDVAARPSDAGARVQPDGRVPVARDGERPAPGVGDTERRDRKSTRLNSSHVKNLVCRLLLEKKKR